MTKERGAPDQSQILQQRDRILGSATFAGSKRMREFLNFLVTESVNDRASRLKEFTIGTAVFGRDESFDPRIDSVVRVEAGRLRSKLMEYYAEAGQEDKVRIEIPKGTYAPSFSYSAPTNDVARQITVTKLGPVLIGVTLVIAVIGIIALYLPGTTAIVPNRTVPLPPHNLAVLPLRDWSSEPQGYFSEAMTDVLIAKLSERPDLRVISLSSVLRYKDAEFDPTIVADELGVDSIVEGTVFRESGNVRITASLTNGDDGQNLWSKTFNRPITSVLKLQEEIASEIAAQLLGTLPPATGTSAPEIDPLAYEAFLKGTYWRNRLTEQGFNRGIIYFRQAIEAQPDYAQAYAALAACHCRLGGHGIEVVRPDVALPESIELAEKALQMDDSLAEPNALLGIISYKYEWDPTAAEFYLQRAIEKNPSLFEAYLWRSQIAEGTGRLEIAVEQARIAERLNPLSRAATLNLGWQLLQSGQLFEAESEFRELIEFDPDFWGGHWGLGHILRARGSYADAIGEFSRAAELEGGHSLPVASLGFTYAMSGQRDQAIEIARELEETASRTYVSPVHIAMIYAGLDERDVAFNWLDKAFEVRARSMAWLTVTREFDGLRDDPRYTALVAAIGIGAN